MAVSVRTVTYEEWLRLPHTSDVREEVVRGEIRRMPPNKWPHTETVENIADCLRSQIDRRVARVVVAQFGLVISKSPLTSRSPDLAVFFCDSLRIEDGYVRSAPALVVEVLSPGNSPEEMEEKRRDYESLDVEDYWLVLPNQRAIEVYSRTDAGLERTSIVTGGALTPKRFPGVSVPVNTVWPD